jgi:hypothetical protein
MTGGIGFSRQGTQSFKDNLNLKNSRQKSTPTTSIKTTTERVDIPGRQESINHRNQQAKLAALQSRVLLFLILAILFIVLIVLGIG